MKITDYCHIFSGTSFAKKPVAQEHGDYYLVESQDINSLGLLELANLKQISAAQFPPPSMSLRACDILIKARGAYHHAIIFPENLEKKVVAGSFFLILRVREPELLRAEHLVSLLNQPVYQSKLSSLAGGATVKHLTKKRLSSLDIVLPDKQRLAHIHQLTQLVQQEKLLQAKLAELQNERYQASVNAYLAAASQELV